METFMKRLALMIAAITLAAPVAARADENSAGAGATHGQTSMHAKMRHAIHRHRSQAAPLVASDKALQDARERRETRAMNELEAAGYSDFNEFKTEGNQYHAVAMKNGQRVSVLINPDSGAVTPER